MSPWYKGWDGEIFENGPNKYDTHGVHVIEEDDDSCVVTELPVGRWTQDYKKYLEELETNGDIFEFTEHHAENKVEFRLTGDMDALQKKSKGKGGLMKFLKLKGSIATSNLVMFDHECKIYKYKQAEDIMKAWYDLRQELYVKRKAWQLRKLLKELRTLESKVRFIKMVLDDEIQIKRVKRRAIVTQLKQKNFLTQT